MGADADPAVMNRFCYLADTTFCFMRSCKKTFAMRVVPESAPSLPHTYPRTLSYRAFVNTHHNIRADTGFTENKKMACLNAQ